MTFISTIIGVEQELSLPDDITGRDELLLNTVPLDDLPHLAARLMPGRVVWVVKEAVEEAAGQISGLLRLLPGARFDVYIPPEYKKIQTVIRAGATGCYALDDAPGSENGLFIDQKCAEALRGYLLAHQKPTQPPVKLSETERHLLNMLATGKSITETAGILFLTADTVRNYYVSLRRKTATRDRAELLIWAVKHGVVELE
ncbi:MAG: LuxR C-terminal-related transcriptional regulator [Clostridia bacterium]|nr:LuxR C-terminal-related transcriptional regulator [Clostridia bacterium]